MNVWEAISAHACKSKTNGIWRFTPCGDCRVYGTWKRDRDEYIVFAGSSGIFCRDCYPREIDAIKALLDADQVVIACGGDSLLRRTNFM
mgnify:CR=1 FL=1